MDQGRDALESFLKERGKYFVVSDPQGVRRLSRLYGIGEEDVKETLRACGFILNIRMPVRAYWAREEIRPSRYPEGLGG